MKFIINPKTKRLVQVGKAKYWSLRREGTINERTLVLEIPKSEVEWRAKAPMTVNSRKQMKSKCPTCFLDPANRKYPVCSSGTCSHSCQGAKAALIRATQQRNTTIQNKALRLLRSSCKAAIQKHPTGH